MTDYRVKVDDLLADWCIANKLEYSDMHDEAFCIRLDRGGVWLHCWYDEGMSEEWHLKQLKGMVNSSNKEKTT